MKNKKSLQSKIRNWIILNPSSFNDTIPVGGARNITVNIVKSNTGSNKLNTAYIIINSNAGDRTVNKNKEDDIYEF